MSKITDVFVYGTLKRGQPNHQIIAPFIDKEIGIGYGFLRGFQIYGANNPFPYIVSSNEPEHKVFGDIMPIMEEKLDDVMDMLDRFEGVPDLYTRNLVQVFQEGETVTSCWAYVWNRELQEGEKPLTQNAWYSQERNDTYARY